MKNLDDVFALYPDLGLFLKYNIGNVSHVYYMCNTCNKCVVRCVYYTSNSCTYNTCVEHM